MPRPRFLKLAEDKRNRILEAAAEEFGSHGYEGASLNRVITKAGISKGAFYYYFDDKADLFVTVVELAWEVILAGQEFNLAELDRRNFWPTLRQKFMDISKKAEETAWVIGIAKLVYHPPPLKDVEEAVAEQFDRVREWLGRLLKRGQKLKAVRTDLPIGLLLAILMAVDEAADRWFLERWAELDPKEIEDLTIAMFAMQQRMLMPTKDRT